jgi:hypothetical protein
MVASFGAAYGRMRDMARIFSSGKSICWMSMPRSSMNGWSWFSMVSRQYLKAKVTEGGSFGAGNKWKLETVKLNDLQIKELDILFDEMMEFSGKKSVK